MINKDMQYFVITLFDYTLFVATSHSISTQNPTEVLFAAKSHVCFEASHAIASGIMYERFREMNLG